MLKRYFTVWADDRRLVTSHIKQHVVSVECFRTTPKGCGGWITFTTKGTEDELNRTQKTIRRLARGKPRFQVVSPLRAERAVEAAVRIADGGR